MMLESCLTTALLQRQNMWPQLQAENTDCYRLFWGTNEGVPGVTVDRYGPQLLIQSFHHPLTPAEVETVVAVSQTRFEPTEVIYNDRSSNHSRRKDPAILSDHSHVGQELGVKYTIKGKHQGQDPLLFLDLRAARRWVLAHASGKSVLNVFAYTCGVGLCAAIAGATEVWNVDFAHSSLDVGGENARLNGLNLEVFKMIHSDFFTAVRQLANLPIQQRRNQSLRHYMKIAPRQFDLVFVDPPRWAKSPFGTIDLIRDYPSVLKPALLATAEGGQLVVTNHVPQVDWEEWVNILKRCARKAGRPIQQIERLEPEADFPSRDGYHPLKVAVLTV